LSWRYYPLYDFFCNLVRQSIIGQDMNSRQLVGGKALRIEPLRLFGILQQRSRAIVTHTFVNARERSIQPDGNTGLVNNPRFSEST
jgi:hypothetical protein